MNLIEILHTGEPVDPVDRLPAAAPEVGKSYATLYKSTGYATMMARELINIARKTDSSILITAQTLPQKGASTRILEKLGFIHAETFMHPEDGEVWQWEHAG